MRRVTLSELQQRRSQASATILKFAAGYNILWGSAVILFPGLFFDLFSMPQPNYPEIWQCVGMIVGVYGLGYYLASFNPARHWPIVVVGLLGKVLGPIGFLGQLFSGKWPLPSGMLIVTNDLIWWLPFLYVLYYARVENYREMARKGAESRAPLERLKALSYEQPLLIVFLRHFGCTFCRETLKDLEKVWRESLQGVGHRLVVVHMASEERGRWFLEQYKIQNALLISDPDCEVYDFFNIPRGSVFQMFGFRSLYRGFSAFFQGGHGLGPLEGEGFQMPGMVIYQEGQIRKEYRFRFAGERPDYAEFMR